MTQDPVSVPGVDRPSLAVLDIVRSIVLVVVYHVAVGAGEELMSTGESLAGRVWVQVASA